MMTNDETTTVQGVTLTSSAAAKVLELITAEGDESLSLRLAVRPGGCSGFSYDMFFDSALDDTDIVNEKDGVRVVVDAESAAMVGGATVDFRDDGLQGAGFAINNPSEQKSCGCGQSFC
ncbi:MAG: iron-sulfur cluster assembly accessory protein [Acidimicrobiia bacterium]|nr:iron-sulfur cluster assembly accessory protein [Acidimicrobiia bacterium]MDX2467967.1 iron-sulfur cluster assembly accessory protein [Acidimicrobiia bacterium]